MKLVRKSTDTKPLIYAGRCRHSASFLYSLRAQIYAKRSAADREREKHFFIELGDEGQALSIKLQDEEEQAFAKGIGFEIGSYVKNKNNELFYVASIGDMGGMLWIKDISIRLVEAAYAKSHWTEFFKHSFNVYDRNVVKTRPLYHIEDHEYMDVYTPVKVEGELLNVP